VVSAAREGSCGFAAPASLHRVGCRL
jgi:hypothetical protein